MAERENEAKSTVEQTPEKVKVAAGGRFITGGVPAMDFHTIALLMLLLCVVTVESSTHQHQGGFSVVEFGAVGDGKTDDSEAFQKAWKAVCESESEQRSNLLVPAGKTFLLKAVEFQGPCKSSSINFQVLGKILAPKKKYFGAAKNSWLLFSNVDGLILNGRGNLDGSGSSWWGTSEKVKGCETRPPVLTLTDCNNLQVRELEIKNAPRGHLMMRKCSNAILSNMHITTPSATSNTDGIDISESTQIRVHDSIIQTGDDCIAINSGSSHINITSVYCGPGHGISIGSLGRDRSSGTVEVVNVVNCTFNGTQNAARIKTWQGGSGFARNILFQDITLVESQNPILINQYYCAHNKDCLQLPCKNQTSAVKISDISFIGFTGTSVTKEAVQLLCSESVPCSGLVLDGINIRASQDLEGGKHDHDKLTSTCLNAHGSSSDYNVPAVPCLLPSLDELLQN